MSFREKGAWACLLTTIAAFVPYFLYLFRMLERGHLTPAVVIGAFICAVLFQVVLQVVAQIAITILSRQEGKDERDVAIDAKAFRNAYFVLGISCFLAIVCVVILAIAPFPLSSDNLRAPAFTSQVFLLCFIVAETTKYLTQVVCYRRGF